MNKIALLPRTLMAVLKLRAKSQDNNVVFDYKQDGIAPQCAVPGLEFDLTSDLYGRIRFLGLEKHKNFLDAHYGANYGWVLDIEDFGEVKKRD